MIKVFLIDDSLVVRNGFRNILSNVKDIQIIGEAENPVDAFVEFKKVGLPDVFILDIEMPKMDGLTFLKQIAKQRPTPVIMCSTLIREGSDSLMEALEYGAVGVIEKPKLKVKDFLSEYRDDVLEQIRAAAISKVTYNINIKPKKQPVKKKKFSNTPAKKIIAIGSSTGGVQVLEEIITNLKENHLPILIVQHMPVGFTASFANRLNFLAPNSHVVEAKEDDIVTMGKVFISPGGIHMEIKKDILNYKIVLKDFPKVNSHKPSVNVLFSSVAKELNGDATGFILTGMGSDGAKGLKLMREAGAKTYAQNEKTATVFGMPKVAIELGAVCKDMSIFEIIKTINSL